MSIAYDSGKKTFTLTGGNVSYVLHIDENGRLMNLYWGEKVPAGSIAFYPEYYPDGASFDLPIYHRPHELPTRGRGWYGVPAVGAVNAQGNDVVDLTYVSHEIFAGKKPLQGLPATYVEDETEADTLVITMKDVLTGLAAHVSYTVFSASGAITRSIRLENTGDSPLYITNLLSASVPVFGNGYDIIHLKGGWAKERQVMRREMGEGEYRISSQRGASGHEHNPFVALCDKTTTEFNGRVWALNFVYSGSFIAGSNVDNLDNSRLFMGMNPETFRWQLNPGSDFQSPEAVMVYSSNGLNGMSHIFHDLYRTRLVRGVWRDKVRPVLINNWEGTYMDFNEEKILAIAESARKIGVELFVLDDGWFGKRNQDNCSLGDWFVNYEKLPNGIDGLARKVNDMGLKFGLWFEPEMVSPDSDLYRAHPDWCLHVDGRSRTEARQQLILDFSRTEVQDYIIKVLSDMLGNASIGYVKWDMNRNMTEHFSCGRAPENQLETQHRYMLGLYRVMETLTSRFPEVLFESCSGGGGRFDAGILHYMPQTWTSDDTDAVERLNIQYGTSFVYPASAMGAHVSAVPNHQTGRISGMRMRGDVAIGGNFGFELDMSALSDEDIETARQLVEEVKKYRELTNKGVFTRLISPFEGEYAAWQFAKDDEALLCVCQKLAHPNTSAIRVRMQGLCPESAYADDEGNEYSGAVLMNMGMWVKLRHDFTSRIVHLRRVK